MKAIHHIFEVEENSWKSHILPVLFMLLQLIALSWISQVYEVESSLYIPQLIRCSTIGFVIYVFIPAKRKQVFFLLASLIALVYFIGWMDAALGIGYTLILFTALIKITSSRWRITTVVLLMALPVGLLIQKGAWAMSHMSAFSLFGSMTIYRLLIFIYDRKHLKQKPALEADLAYFFMLPNMALNLFPAVDYTRWIKNFESEKALLIQKKGVQWMVLGMFHLILYRILYFYWALPLTGVEDLHTYIWHSCSTYALIIRLSGLFHLAVGVLCLFGYNMQPIFDNYFLANSFSDIWRRLNVYFRDFMVKIFYYPVYFKIRHLGNQKATVISILLMFIISWMLHSYQWFWFKGSFPLKWVDVIFWNTFGILVASSVFLPKGNWQKKAEQTPWFFEGLQMGKILTTFLAMSLLWSLWSVNTLAEWSRMVSLAIRSPLHQYVQLALVIASIWIIGTVLYRLAERYQWPAFFNPQPSSGLASFWSVAMLAGLLTLQLSPVHQSIGKSLGVDMNGVLSAKLSAEDAELQVDGYYTELLFGNNLTSPLASMKTPGGKQFQHTEGARIIPGFRHLGMNPNTSIQFKGKTFTINSWGFRDQEYSLVPPPNTIRSIFMGGSFVAGSGVADEEVVDVLLESRMNTPDAPVRYEFLNMGCPHYDLLECVLQFEEDHLERFEPQYLFYFSHGKDLHRNNKDILKAFKQDFHLPYDFLTEAIEKSGISKNMTDQEILERLQPYGEDILKNTYRELMNHCTRNGITPVWVYWPTVDNRNVQKEAKKVLRRIVEELGFIVVDLEGIYAPYDKHELTVSAEDIHPSPQNHQLVADTLYQFIQTTLLPNAEGQN